jgi:hypothetical protein
MNRVMHHARRRRTVVHHAVMHGLAVHDVVNRVMDGLRHRRRSHQGAQRNQTRNQ